MNCPQCRTALADGSAFCNKCGAPLAAGATAPPKPAPPAPVAASASPLQPGVLPPDEPEQELWTGRFSGKALSHLLLMAFVWLTVIAIVYFKWLNTDNNWKPFFNWACTILVLAPFVYIGWIYLYSKLAIRYRLTTHRFFLTRGVFARRMDEIELVRVDDVSVSQNILQRIFNVGDVTLIASDSTDPRLEIAGIDDPIAVKEQIRTNVQKRGRRSVNLRQV